MAWRSTGCCAAACPSSGRPPTRASTSSATRPGSPSTTRTATPVPGLDVMIRHNPFSPTDDVGLHRGTRLAPAPRPTRRSGPDTGQAPDAVPARRDRHPSRRPHRPAPRCRRHRVVPALPGAGRTPRALAGRRGGDRSGSAPAEHAAPAGPRGVARGRPLPRQPGLLLPRVTARGTRRPAARHRRTQRHVRLRRGHRRTLRLLPRASTTCSASSARSAPNASPTNELLLAAFRRFLTDVATGPARLRTSLPAHLLDSPVLRCKANLLTRLHGLDELVGPGRHPVRLRHHHQPPSFLRNMTHPVS